MKTTALLALSLAGAVALAVGARRGPERGSPVHYEPVAAPGSGPSIDDDDDATDERAIAGDVRETFDVAEYTYLRLATPSGETWAAVSKTPVNLGSRVRIDGATRMENFASPTLKRTFPEIYFGTLAKSDGSLPPGHPVIAPQSSPHAPTGVSAAPELRLVKVPRAPGPAGHTIAELYAQQGGLKDRRVRVRGQVTKVTAGVLGKNFIHLRDGSDAEHDLVVTTQAQTQIGELITLEGSLRLNVDLGIGYKFALLLEDASALPAL